MAPGPLISSPRNLKILLSILILQELIKSTLFFSFSGGTGMKVGAALSLRPWRISSSTRLADFGILMIWNVWNDDGESGRDSWSMTESERGSSLLSSLSGLMSGEALLTASTILDEIARGAEGC